MRSLYEHLRDANPKGIPHREAIQLFLWIFCTKDFLPAHLYRLELSKDVLVETFQKLSADGLIIETVGQDAPAWEDLVREFLLGNYAQDPGFPSRANRYFQ